MKRCYQCGNEQPLTNFHKNKTRDDGLQNRCKSCVALYDKRRLDKGEYRGRRNEANRRYRYRVKYGLTESEVLNIIEGQNFCCAICGIDEEDTPQKILHIDHNHDTGKVRGALCQSCNTGIGQFKDSIDLLKVAIEYLAKDGD